MAPSLEKIQQLSTRVGSQDSTITELVTVRSEQDYRVEQLIPDNVILQKTIKVNSRMNNLVIKGLRTRKAVTTSVILELIVPSSSVNRPSISFLEVSAFQSHSKISLSRSEWWNYCWWFNKGNEEGQPRPASPASGLIFESSCSRRSLRSPYSPQRSQFVNENLTRRNSGIFSEARMSVKMKKFAKSWTFGGSVYVLPTESGSKPIRMTEMSDLLCTRTCHSLITGIRRNRYISFIRAWQSFGLTRLLWLSSAVLKTRGQSRIYMEP